MRSAPRTSPDLPGWLRSAIRDPAALELLALVRAIERHRGIRLGDDPSADIFHLRIRARAALSAAPGARLQVETTDPPVETPPVPGPGPLHPHVTPSPPPRIELLLRGYSALVGPGTPLPLPLAERASGPGPGAERLRSFLDLFHHRLFTHLVRGLARLRIPQRSVDATLWEEQLLRMAGLASSHSVIPRPLRRRLLPIVLGACGPPTPAQLDQALRICLAPLTGPALRVRTRTLTETRAPRPAASLGPLGSPNARLRGATTGPGLRLGNRLPIRNSITIAVHGPAPSLDTFAKDQPGHQTIGELVELLAPPETPWALNLYPRERRPPRLGSARLGRAWLPGAGASPWRVPGNE